jgi:hypothetical protein
MMPFYPNEPKMRKGSQTASEMIKVPFCTCVFELMVDILLEHLKKYDFAQAILELMMTFYSNILKSAILHMRF